MKKMAKIIGMIFATLLLLEFNCYAQGNVIYGCYKKNDGHLRIVPKGMACHPHETSLSWNMSGPAGPQGPPGPTGPPGPQGPQGPQAPLVKGNQIPRVYDANGQFLGIMPGDVDGFLSVYIPSLSRFIFISPDDGNVDPFNPAVYLYFEDSNCLGAPYVDTNIRYLVFQLGKDYYKADDAAAQTKKINSISSPVWDGTRRCQPRSSIDIPVLASIQVGLPFTLPVALPLHFEQ